MNNFTRLINKIITKPHLFFWIPIPILLIIGLLLGLDEKLDINVHDTYFVFRIIELCILISLVLGIIGLGYWIVLKANRTLSKWLNILHIFLTYSSIFCIWFIPLIQTKFGEYGFMDIITYSVFIVLFILSLILAQFLYVLNLILAFFKKKTLIV